jgi:hypothetical protein
MVEEKIFMARVAEQAERFDDMVDFLRPLLKEKGGDFSVEERNLLSVGFKNLIGGKRTAIRTISAIEQNPKYSKFGGALGNYKKKIEGELQKNCQDIIDMIKQDGMKTFARFTRVGGRPRRFSTRTPYHGGNAFALWVTALMAGYSSPFWITFKQAEEAGARVRKGEKGTPIIYADRWKPEGAAPDDPGRMFMRHYTVFNAEQVEIARLKAELARVKMERDILKKAAAYFAKQSG